MSYNVEIVTEPVTLGEGPHWDHAAQALYFVSIYDYSIHKYVPATKTHTSAKLETRTSFIIPIEGKPDFFAVSQGKKLVEVHWTGSGEAKIIRVIAELDEGNPLTNINDGKADPKGRLFAGTLGIEYEVGKFYLKLGRLYRVHGSGRTEQLEDDIDLSNGMCWDVARRAYYYADSFEYVVRRYDYDIETGKISNRTNVFEIKKHGLEGIVDGMTIDTDGNLWIALYGGRQVIKVDPSSGALLQTIPIPALQVTSCVFGGANLDELYVTSGAKNRGEKQLPPCGSTFRITGLGARGEPSVNAKLRGL